MLAISNHVKRKKDERNPLNLALIAQVEESLSVVDVDEIVAKNNITDLCTLEILHDIAISKNMKMNSYAPKVQTSQEFQFHNLLHLSAFDNSFQFETLATVIMVILKK
jgi:hypothetical protein